MYISYSVGWIVIILMSSVFLYNIDIKYFGMICRYNSGMRAFSGSGPRYVDDTLRVQFSVTSERIFFLYIIQPTSST